MQRMTDPGTVALLFNVARNSGDLDKAMDLLADDVVFHLEPPHFGASGELKGKPAVRRYLQLQVEDHFRAEYYAVQVVGNKATFHITASSETYRQKGIEALNGKGEMVVENAKIKRFDYQSTPETAREVQERKVAAPQ